MSLSLFLRCGQTRIFSRPILTLCTFGKTNAATCQSSNFHSLCNDHTKVGTNFLVPAQLPLINTVCGMKTKGKLNLRCKSCYFVVRQGRRYVMCKEHGRHKQQAMVKQEKNTWILTHATQSKVRPW